MPLVARPEGKGKQPYVFSLVTMEMPQPNTTLDIAGNSQEEIDDWIQKINEVAMTSEAKVPDFSAWMSTLKGESRIKH